MAENAKLEARMKIATLATEVEELAAKISALKAEQSAKQKELHETKRALRASEAGK